MWVVTAGFNGTVALQKVESGQIQIAIQCQRLQPFSYFPELEANGQQKMDNENRKKQLDNVLFGLKQIGERFANEMQGLTKKCEDLTDQTTDLRSKLAALKKQGIPFTECPHFFYFISSKFPMSFCKLSRWTLFDPL